MRPVAVIAAIASASLAASAGADERPGDEAPPRPAAGGEVRMVVEPEHLVLGEGGEARITASLPPGTEAVVFYAAHGRMSQIEQLSGTEAVALYEPPTDDFRPRVDVVAVMAVGGEGRRWGYVALPLYGQGKAGIETRPFAEATVRIAGKQYGPVKANRRGKAEIRVEVPPGERFGYDDRGTPVDLGLPPTPRAAIFAAEPEIRMDRPEPVEVFGVVVGPRGGMDEGSSLVVRADRGEIEDLKSVGEGAFLGEYAPPAEGEGVVQVEAGVSGDDAPFEVAEIVLVPAEEAVPGPSGAEPGAEPGPGGEVPEPAGLAWLDVPLKAGLAWNTGSIRAFHFSAGLGVKLPILDGRLRLGAEAGFSWAGGESGAGGGSGDMTADTWIAPIGALAAYHLSLIPDLDLAISAVGAVVLVDNTVESPGGEGSEAFSQHERGYYGAAGGGLSIEWTVGPGALLFEARYLWIGGDMETVDGTLSSLFFDVGYRFWILPE